MKLYPAGQTYAAFDEVLAFVDRANHYFAKTRTVGPDLLATILANEVIVGGIALEGSANRIAVGVVEYRGVETVDLAKTWIAVVGHLNPTQVGVDLAVGKWHHIVD